MANASLIHGAQCIVEDFGLCAFGPDSSSTTQRPELQFQRKLNEAAATATPAGLEATVLS